MNFTELLRVTFLVADKMPAHKNNRRCGGVSLDPQSLKVI